ncbi:MAG: ATP-binding cassette domain-containing protein [Deltaproteobacteria bacterium]|nr:ATP-binding cassette domain-containing protein [Deltaproteobacteria bacterium]
MTILTAKNISAGFGGTNLFEDVNFSVSEGDRIGLLGNNGSGKSTLLKIITGKFPMDSGELITSQGFSVALLNQEVPDLEGTVYENMAMGISGGEYLSRWHKMDHNKSSHELSELQMEIDTRNLWETDTKLNEIATKLGLDVDADTKKLSGGFKRKVLLGKALVSQPSLLLLDEPTNHLDIPSILKLEELIYKFQGAVFFVTHDRAFLRRISNKIMEIDLGRMNIWNMSYGDYLKRRESLMESEKKHLDRFQKKIQREEQWLHKGISARRTRNEGRLRNLLKMREEWKSRRRERKEAGFSLENKNYGGKIALRCENVDFSWGDKKIINNFSTIVMKGDKIGVVGANGTGKTTLLKVLLGDLSPETGNIKHGSNLRVIYSDQLRTAIDDNKSLKNNICEGTDMVEVNGKLKHVISYLREFMFRPEQMDSPAGILSGGERARLALAKLFLMETNFLVLDEPTNDLDLETLEHLESLCVNFSGTVILVSHDREFLNNVAAATFYLDGTGNVMEFAGGYDDIFWQLDENPEKTEKKQIKQPKRTREKTKRSYREEEEYKILPEQIASMENEHMELVNLIQDPVFYERRGHEIQDITAKMQKIEKELEVLYERWVELSEYDN